DLRRPSRRLRRPAARRQPRPLVPVPAGEARTALALRAGGRGRGEDGADDRGRVRPQTEDDGRPLGHRRRRRDALAARPPALLLARAALAPPAALPDTVPPRSRPRRQCGAARRRLGLLGDLHLPALLPARRALRLAGAAGAVPDRALLRPHHGLDRRRPL